MPTTFINLSFAKEEDKSSLLCLAFFSGLMLPLSFAPFHFPGIALLSLAFFYALLTHPNSKAAFRSGFYFGLGYFGIGISWIYVSIHEYGHLNAACSVLITLLFVTYLAFFPAFCACIFSWCVSSLQRKRGFITSLLFSACWVLSEYARSTLFGGFPWLLIGFGQVDAPTHYLLPILGTFGLSFYTCLVAALLASFFGFRGWKRTLGTLNLLILLFLPMIFSAKKWVEKTHDPISVGVIQANLSMRDKWDEDLFWQLLEHYKHEITELLGTQVVVMPESAIPLPQMYVDSYLQTLHEAALSANTGILLGIPKPASMEDDTYFNALMTLGTAQGTYLKQHLVPFGEYIPTPFRHLAHWLGVPNANLIRGKSKQSLITIHALPLAALICYELAYEELLRQQLPAAKWIVSISDAGWFGHSLAVYQQQQMAQARSLESARYQIMANNDGLSSVINSEGELIDFLPAFTQGRLKAELLPVSGSTPWIHFGSRPTLFFCILIILSYTIYRIIGLKYNRDPIAAGYKRRYPYQPH